MEKRRQKLHEILCDILGSRNVYFQPPSSKKMNYPAIVYSLSNIQKSSANNNTYAKRNAYEITLIDRDPDNETVDKIASLPRCRFDRSFVSDNLNHYVFTLYF